MKKYNINKDETKGKVVYLEYNKDGYKISPKKNKKDAIEVNKIIFVSPELTQKLIKKKIKTKVSKLLLELNTTYDDESDGGETRLISMQKEAERLRINLMKKYKDYLGGKYYNLTLKKIELIIEEYNMKLYKINERKQIALFNAMFNQFEQYEQYEQYEVKKGKGR